MGFAAVRLLHPMACPSTNSEVQDLFAKLLEKRFDTQEEAQKSAEILKARYPLLQVKVYDALSSGITSRSPPVHARRVLLWLTAVLYHGRASVVPQRPADQRLSRSTVAAGDATICTSTSESVTGNEQLCPRQTNAAPSVVA